MPANNPARQPSMLVESLRDWARGCYAQEAAVELLFRGFGGRFASTAYPWVIKDGEQVDWIWLDGEQLITATGCLSSNEQRVLALAGALASGAAVSDLGVLLAGLDRANLHLVLAAFAHAGGAHEQVEALMNGDHLAWRRHDPLLAWPESSETSERAEVAP